MQITDIDQASSTIVAARSTVIVFDNGRWAHFAWTEDRGISLSTEVPRWPDLGKFTIVNGDSAFRAQHWKRSQGLGVSGP